MWLVRSDFTACLSSLDLLLLETYKLFADMAPLPNNRGHPFEICLFKHARMECPGKSFVTLKTSSVHTYCIYKRTNLGTPLRLHTNSNTAPMTDLVYTYTQTCPYPPYQYNCQVYKGGTFCVSSSMSHTTDFWPSEPEDPQLVNLSARLSELTAQLGRIAQSLMVNLAVSENLSDYPNNDEAKEILNSIPDHLAKCRDSVLLLTTSEPLFLESVWTAHEYTLGMLGAFPTEDKHRSIRSRFAKVVLETRLEGSRPLDRLEELLSLVDHLASTPLSR